MFHARHVAAPALLAPLLLALAASAADRPTLVVTEQSLGELPAGVSPESVVISPDWRHAAFILPLNGKQAVVLDGVQQKAYDTVAHGSIRFTLDGRRFGYLVCAGQRGFAVIDGVEGPAFDGVANLEFSPDGRRTVYKAMRFRKALVFKGDGPLPFFTGWHWEEVTSEIPVVDGVAGKEYKNVWRYHFSPDGRRWACKVADEKNEHFIIDGVGQKPFPEVFDRSFQFSPDSRHFVYMVRRGPRYRLVVDGVEGPSEYEVLSTESPFFSPDSRTLAATAFHRKPDGSAKPVCVLGDWQSREYDIVNRTTPVFSPDGKHVAWAVQRDGADYILIDGDELKAPPGAAAPQWSPDGKRFCYIAERDGKYVMVIAGEPGPACDCVGYGSLHFSPDGRHAAYAAKRRGQWVVVADGTEGREYEGLRDLVVGPDGWHVAYVASRGGRELVVVDDMESPAYDGNPGPDVMVIDGPQWHRTVLHNGDYVEDMEAYDYERRFGRTPVQFDGPTTLHTIVLKGRELVLVRFEIR